MRTTLFFLSIIWTTSTVAQTFTNVAAAANVDIGGNKDGGVSFADFNNDGCLDLLVNTNDHGRRSRLLQNNCDYPNPTFTDVTASLAPALLDRTCERSAMWGDFNNDGYIDFMRNTSGRLQVFRNRGPSATPPWSFGDAVGNPDYEITGLAGGFNSEGLAWVDYNGDGFLDIMLENHNFGVDILLNPGDCSANFIHITPNSNPLGLYISATDGDYMSASDYNDDGWVDLLCRKRDQNDLLQNNSGTGFIDQGNIDQATNGNKGGVDFADFDNDGKLDIIWTSNGTNQIWLQSGSGTFAASGEPEASSGVSVGNNIDGCATGDIDNDGDIDLFFTDNNGASFLFINNSTPGNLSFTQTNLGIDVNGNGEGCVFTDYDNDGDLDLYVNRHGNNQLWQNDLNNSNYLFVEPLLDLGGGFTRTDHGTLVTLYRSDGTTLAGGPRDARRSFGHGTQTESRIHFGLPDGSSASYRLVMKYTYIGGERTIIDTMITPSVLPDQTFRLVRDSFGVLSNIGCNLLPVELYTFRATAEEENIMLKWETLSESNNDRFVIQHSTDATHYREMATVNGSGTSLSTRHYEYRHERPESGIHYYRLYQIDHNGTQSGPWLAAASVESEALAFRVFPNPILPAHQEWAVQVSGIGPEGVILSIVDAVGRIIEQKEIFSTNGQSTVIFSKTARLRPGSYYIRLMNQRQRISRNLIIH